jgi:hypothetical protein
MFHGMFHDMFHGMFVSKWAAMRHGFTICLFISPDLDGYRAPKGTVLLASPSSQVKSSVLSIALTL